MKKANRIISTVLVVLMLLTSVPLEGFVGVELPDWFNLKASAVEKNGFVYTALNGTFCQVTGYTGNDTEVIIPQELDGYIVQSAGDNLFKNNTKIESVTFPETLETVGSSTFYGCTSLKSVVFYPNVTNIGSNMFYGCTALEEISIPESVTSIGSYAFYGCTALSDIDFSSGLLSIGGYAFSGCSSLLEVNLPNTLTTIYAYAFENCQFESIDIPDSVSTMSSDAFYNCTKLSSVGYPAGWTTTLSIYISDTSSTS